MDKTYKILIADDSKLILLSIHEMLINDINNTYSVIKANDGREACTLAFKHIPDIILLDIEMPEMDGIEATKKIKSNEKLKHIPIIIMSATRNFHNAFLAGADDFLLKPINEYELLLRIQFNLKLAITSQELSLKHKALEEQQSEVIAQRDTIYVQQKELLGDLTYARTIQNAIFPDTALFNELCNSHFIFNQPKHIVSGDFYFLAKKNEYFVFALGDCTGHGISGALMTIAGNAFLNDIINSTLEANIILDELRLRVIKLLHQKGEIGEASNGMDISLCVFNTETKKIQFAGANNPMYLKRWNKNELDIIKADRMPIGIHINFQKPFENQEFTINNGDMLYLFSDGYPDQFGGEKNKKMRYNEFQKLLLSISGLSILEQLKRIENHMNNWMHNTEQVDDILVIGLKF